MNIEANITSGQNPRIKEIVQLQEKSRLRKERGLFVVEGVREIQHCLEGGYRIEELYVNPGIIPGFEEELSAMFATLSMPHHGDSFSPELYTISNNVYEKIAYRDSTEGVVAIVRAKSHTLEELESVLEKRSSPFIIVTEEVEKPGNIGALLRTADACGADAVIVCNTLTDIYNPNIIRSSVGGVFTNNIAVCSNEQAIQWLKAKGISIYTAQLQDSVPYYNSDFTAPTAIVMGSEAKGLSPLWREASDKKIIIPMLGKIDSLNVSTSAAILCYEVVRQRNL